jgi:hypothetical protein
MFFLYENIYKIAIKKKYIRRDYSLDDVESGSVADFYRELSGPALPPVPRRDCPPVKLPRPRSPPWPRPLASPRPPC